jgi:tetratricopeptide (TPR) repeat protein
MFTPALLLPLALATGSPVLTMTTPEGKEQVVASAVTADPAEEAAQEQAMAQAQQLVIGGNLDEALALVDTVIGHYQAKYADPETRWYVARSSEEELAYLLRAAVAADKGEAGAFKQARALRVQWANAWYLKGYALVELKRLDEARAALEHAVALSPYNARFHSELAEVAKAERKWDAALAHFLAAEDAAAFSEKRYQVRDRTQALRGQAFAYVEMGKLDEAEKVLKRPLELDGNDARAKEELEYIEKVRKP